MRCQGDRLPWTWSTATSIRLASTWPRCVHSHPNSLALTPAAGYLFGGLALGIIGLVRRHQLHIAVRAAQRLDSREAVCLGGIQRPRYALPAQARYGPSGNSAAPPQD